MTIETLYRGQSGHLTTEHAASSYGLPVLLMDGNAYGPADILPYWSQLPPTAAEYVYQWALTGDVLERELAHRFCRQWPDGPQVLIEAPR